MVGSASFRGSFDDFFEVPASVLDALGTPAKRPLVRVTINGVETRTRLMVYGGKTLIGLRRDQQKAMQVAPGQIFEVHVALDAEERTVEVPAELATVFAADPEAERIFEGLSFTNRKEYVEWCTGAKRPETRQKRLSQVPGLLKSGRRTPMAP